jgi:mono/diheme cytochrome c family protein
MRLRVLAIIAMTWVAACSPGRQHAQPKGTVTDASWAAARGSVLYAAYCGGCHGPYGHGDGPVAAVLGLQPADLRAPGLLDRASDREIVERALQGVPLKTSPRRNAVAEDLEVDAIRD